MYNILVEKNLILQLKRFFVVIYSYLLLLCILIYFISVSKWGMWAQCSDARKLNSGKKWVQKKYSRGPQEYISLFYFYISTWFFPTLFSDTRLFLLQWMRAHCHAAETNLSVSSQTKAQRVRKTGKQNPYTNYFHIKMPPLYWIVITQCWCGWA